jgi:hypothetical protein
MGFIIKQPLETNQGLLMESYVRIETYIVNVYGGTIGATVAMYPTKQAAADSFAEYYGEPSSKPSQIVGVSITYDNKEIEYPTYFEFPITSSVQVDIPMFENTTETKVSTYYDFDETGNIIEKTREEEIIKSIQTGTQTITKYKVDIKQAENNVYAFAYDLVKKEFGKIFGDKNIIDE